MLLVAAIGIDANGDKHPLGLVEGATAADSGANRPRFRDLFAHHSDLKSPIVPR
jgi:hypothetical protein